MSIKVLNKKDFPAFLEKLMAEFDVIGPRETEGIVMFGPLNSPGDLVGEDFANTRNSPKEAFFPRCETLYAWKRGETGGAVDLPQGLKRQRVLLSIRPCDARALEALDKVFMQEPYFDPYYKDKRENTILVGKACVEAPYQSCFCASMGDGPFNEKNLDMIYFDAGEKLIFKSLTEKGEKLFGLGGFKDAGKDEQAAWDKAQKNAEASLESKVNIQGLKEKLDGAFSDAVWDGIHEKCVGCGTCTFVCPTCHCFDISDETDKDKALRIRTWDSCMFPLFTLHGSGHNPRSAHKQRIRQRFMHKLNYFPENFGITACVGCGRCVQFCPVNLDIREVIEELRNVSEPGKK